MPRSMARRAPSRTSTGTGVSHTPCARLMPLIFSHSMDITRISDCTVRAARRLRFRGMSGSLPLERSSAYCKSALLRSRRYSYLRATMGSTRMARRAGMEDRQYERRRTGRGRGVSIKPGLEGFGGANLGRDAAHGLWPNGLRARPAGRAIQRFCMVKSIKTRPT